MRVDDLVKFIDNRERHRRAKEEGGWRIFGGGNSAKPDPIISEYRFCNVRRNDDRVTKYVLKEFLPQFDEFVWFAAVVARLFNNESTLKAAAQYTVPFKPEKLRAMLHYRAAHGNKNFNAAYIVSTNGRAMDKVDYVVDIILTPLWKDRHKIDKALDRCSTLAEAHVLISSWQGLGSFMAAQVIADIKYVPGGRDWPDFHTFAASGPGSRRGLNRVMSRDIKAPWKEQDFRLTLLQLRDSVNIALKMEPITAQDIQNSLCEFDKYERARLGEGRPKQKYRPAQLPWKE